VDLGLFIRQFTQLVNKLELKEGNKGPQLIAILSGEHLAITLAYAATKLAITDIASIGRYIWVSARVWSS
jgi:hypothetical protein